MFIQLKHALMDGRERRTFIDFRVGKKEKERVKEEWEKERRWRRDEKAKRERKGTKLNGESEPASLSSPRVTFLGTPVDFERAIETPFYLLVTHPSISVQTRTCLVIHDECKVTCMRGTRIHLRSQTWYDEWKSNVSGMKMGWYPKWWDWKSIKVMDKGMDKCDG